MRSVLLTATLTQSAALGVAGRADHRHATYDHVPGSALRGALATAWLRTPGAAGHDEQAFREVFEGDGVFGPLHSTESPPTPLSVWVHKTASDPTCVTPWWDEVDGPAPEHCPTCRPSRARLERSKGQPVGSPEIRARTRVALDARGVAADGALFRRAALAEGTVLRGWLTGSAVDALMPAGRLVTRLRFGGERSIRGLGEVTAVEALPPVPEIRDSDVIIRLASPAVFVDPHGHPTDTPDVSELAEVLGVKEVIAVTTQPGWTRWTEIGGWHMASGLPKPRDRAVAAGSTYRIRCDRPPDPDRLIELAARGVGLRRREGLGCVHRLIEPTELRNRVAARASAADVVPLLTWSKWPRLAPLVRANTGRPVPVDHLLRRVLLDQTLNDSQLAALQLLIDIPSEEQVVRLLDELEPR